MAALTYTVKPATYSPCYAFDLEWSDGWGDSITYDQAVMLVEETSVSVHGKEQFVGAALASLLNRPPLHF